MARMVSSMSVFLILCCRLAATLAFQHAPVARFPSRQSLIPLAAMDEYVSLDNYNSVLESPGAAEMASGGDASLLIAVGIATVAVVGLAIAQLPKILNEEEKAPAFSPTPPKTRPPLATTTKSKAAYPRVKVVEPVATEPKEAVQNSPKIDVLPPKPTKDIEETIPKIETIQSKTDTIQVIPEAKEKPLIDNNQNKEPTKEPSLFFAAREDLSWEQEQATKALDANDRAGLLDSLRRVTGLVRTARTELKEERGLRIRAEEQLTVVTKEMQQMEDAVELGQNQLAKTNLELGQTKNLLSATQRDLANAKKDLNVLQEERQSIRKMGKVAWQLSKQRVGNRFRRIRGKKG